MCPKISIITPSFNQGLYLEETIDSVLSQTFRDFEYIVIDGGSTDESIDIIKKYQHQIDYWVSEPDLGQAHAINKGLTIARGEIIGWLNSDDIYEKNTLEKVNEFSKNLKEPFIITGQARFFNNKEVIWEPGKNKAYVIKRKDYTEFELLKCWETSLAQPSTFWSANITKAIGYLDEDLHFALDLDYWLKAIRNGIQIFITKEILSNFRYHEKSKTATKQEIFQKELKLLAEKYLDEKELKKFNVSYKSFSQGLKLLKEARDIYNENPAESMKLAKKAFFNRPITFYSNFSIYRSLIFRYLINYRK